MTIETYDDTNNVSGKFSGVIHEDNDELEDACKYSIEHTIEGEFNLIRVL